MRLLVCFFLLTLLNGSNVFAQRQEEVQPQPVQDKSFWDRIFIGGNFGLQFGTTTFINLSPQVGYRVTDKFVPGIGLTYIYSSYIGRFNSRVKTSIYGGSVFGKYFFTDNLFAHAEYEELNVEVSDDTVTIYSRIWVPSLYIGGGYNQPIGQRGFVQLLLLFEVLQDRNFPFYRSNPSIRIGFGF